MPRHTLEAIAAAIDYAVLKPDATLADVRSAAELCRCKGIGNLCVRPCDAREAAGFLHGSKTSLSVVVGFPHGGSLIEVKALETRRAFEAGAAEVDMVMAIGALKAGYTAIVQADIAAVVREAAAFGGRVKVILETALLTPEEIVLATETAVHAGADFVKTSTGFNSGGATPEAVALMVKTATGRIQVKASGGIRDRAAAELYLDLGATRLGVGSIDNILT